MRPDVRDPENLVAPGLHLLPRFAVICTQAPRISARRRALEGTLDVDAPPTHWISTALALGPNILGLLSR